MSSPLACSKPVHPPKRRPTDAPEIDRRMAEITGAEIGANYQKFVGGIALGRAETPENVAAFVSYLAGPDSDYMTGQAPLIDGGIVYR